MRRSKRQVEGTSPPADSEPDGWDGPRNKRLKVISLSSLGEEDEPSRAKSMVIKPPSPPKRELRVKTERPQARTGRASYIEWPTSDEEESSSGSEEYSDEYSEGAEGQLVDYTDIELFLSERPLDKGSGPSSNGTELLVKWKGFSYLHVTWEPAESVESGCNRQAEGYSKAQIGLRIRLKNFREKWRGIDSFAGGFDPDFIKVGRVLDRKVNKKTGVEKYYIKWKGLPYCEATWEAETDCVGKAKGFQKQLKSWMDRKPIYELAKEILGPRRDPYVKCKFGALRRDFIKYEATPAFLNKENAQNELYPYQLEGLNWLEFSWQTGQNVILGDEMGLGKTVQALSLVASLASRGCARPHLVVAPLSTILNWEREAEKWAPQLNVIRYSGTAEERKAIYKYEFAEAQEVGGGKKVPLRQRIKVHLILTTYEMVLQGSADLGKLEYGSMIVDEGHRLKNRASRLFGALKKFKCEQRVILTGTPLQNNLEELFMLMHFIDPKKFTHNQVEEFLEEFGDIDKKEQIEELHNLLKPHLLRRMKHDVLKDLPPKKEQIVLVEMSHEQKDVYKALLTENFQLLSSKSKAKVSGLKNLLMDLRKCCQHPSLITKNFNTLSKRRIETFTKRSGKLHLLERMLEKLIKGGHRVLIYSQFVLVLDMMQEWLEVKGIQSLMLDGSVKGKDRQRRVDIFNSNEGGTYSVFLLSTKAGGLGINLATADTVIIFDSDWNPHNDIQAQARAHRLGQSKEVMIYRLVTRATVEERMVEVAKRKMVLEHLVVSKGGNEQTMKQEDIDDVLRYGVEELFQKEEECSSPEGEKDASKGRTTMAQNEIGAGREGGNKGKGVYYDDEALEKILDRKLAWEQGEEEVKENQHLQAFKVANFEIQEGNFWEDILQDAAAEQAAVEEQQLGKGMREKKKLDQSIVDLINEGSPHKTKKDAKSKKTVFMENHPDHEYDPSSSEEEDESDDENDENYSGADQVAIPDPLSDTAAIRGFTKKDRRMFFNTLLKFGVGGDSEGDEDEFVRHKEHMPHKTTEEIEKYGQFFMKHLLENDNQSSPFTKIRQEILVEGKKEFIATRIADIHLIRAEVDECEKKAKLQEQGGEQRPMSEYSKIRLDVMKEGPLAKVGWNASHDLNILQGVLKYGYGEWREMLANGNLDFPHLLSKANHPEDKSRPGWISNRVRKYVKLLRQSYSRGQTDRETVHQQPAVPLPTDGQLAESWRHPQGIEEGARREAIDNDSKDDCIIVEVNNKPQPVMPTIQAQASQERAAMIQAAAPPFSMPMSMNSLQFSHHLPTIGYQQPTMMSTYNLPMPVQQMLLHQNNMQAFAGTTLNSAIVQNTMMANILDLQQRQTSSGVAAPAGTINPSTNALISLLNPHFNFNATQPRQM